jgi:hypothetical protein
VTGLSDKHMPHADICHIIGKVHLYTHWPLVHFPTSVVKWDTSHKSHLSNTPVMRTWFKRISQVWAK